MKILPPITITDSLLFSSTFANDVADWSAGTYLLGDEAVEDHTVYEVVADPSTTDQPSVGAAKATPTWIAKYADNEYRMFDQSIGTVSTGTGTESVVIEPVSGITTLVLIGVECAEVTVTVEDSGGAEIYSETQTLFSIAAPDWWEYFFGDREYRRTAIFDGIPGSVVNPTVTVEVTNGASGAISVGTLALGKIQTYASAVDYGASGGIRDFSYIAQDDFGNRSIVERQYATEASWSIRVEKRLADRLYRALAAGRATPRVYIGSGEYDSHIVYGIPEDWRQIVDLPNHVAVEIDLSGLV